MVSPLATPPPEKVMCSPLVSVTVFEIVTVVAVVDTTVVPAGIPEPPVTVMPAFTPVVEAKVRVLVLLLPKLGWVVLGGPTVTVIGDGARECYSGRGLRHHRGAGRDRGGVARIGNSQARRNRWRHRRESRMVLPAAVAALVVSVAAVTPVMGLEIVTVVRSSIPPWCWPGSRRGWYDQQQPSRTSPLPAPTRNLRFRCRGRGFIGVSRGDSDDGARECHCVPVHRHHRGAGRDHGGVGGRGIGDRGAGDHVRRHRRSEGQNGAADRPSPRWRSPTAEIRGIAGAAIAEQR